METKSVLNAIKQIKSDNKQRKFTQRYDLIISLKNFDLKKDKLDFFLDLHNSIGKARKICALVAGELSDQAKKVCDSTVILDDFEKYLSNKASLRKLAEQNDYFIAQANIMPKIAQSFGKVLGSRGKMPNPKAGCVVPPNTNLEQIKEKLQKRIRVQATKAAIVQCVVGSENQSDEEVADNVVTLYKALLTNLPLQENNIKKTYLKFTMGKPVEVK